MSALYPKKVAPFNATEARQLGKTSSPKLEVPGPGSYQSLRSDFSKTLAAKGIGEAGSYLVNDNGHINQRTQSYVNSGGRKPSDQFLFSPVGPGSYEQRVSDFERNKNVSGPFISAPS